MSPGSGPLAIRANGLKARAAWWGGFQTRPYVFSGPSMVCLVIANHCIIATFSQTGHMAVENNLGGLGDSLMVRTKGHVHGPPPGRARRAGRKPLRRTGAHP